MSYSLKNERGNSNMNLRIQKIVRETVQESLKELNITNLNNARENSLKLKNIQTDIVKPNQTFLF